MLRCHRLGLGNGLLGSAVIDCAATAQSEPTRRHARCQHANASPSSQRSHYDVLGVAPTATGDEIKAAYFKLSKQLHPDAQKGGGETSRSGGVEQADLNAAYEVLGKAANRQSYDQDRRGYARGGMAPPPRPAGSARPAAGDSSYWQEVHRRQRQAYEEVFSRHRAERERAHRATGASHEQMWRQAQDRRRKSFEHLFNRYAEEERAEFRRRAATVQRTPFDENDPFIHQMSFHLVRVVSLFLMFTLVLAIIVAPVPNRAAFGQSEGDFRKQSDRRRAEDAILKKYGY